jgi:hypothetical protein
LWSIHPQGGDCRPASRRKSDKLASIGAPGEVLHPIVPLGMKQFDDVAHHGIDSGSSVRFVTIAHGASQAEILKGRRTACGDGRDVLKFERDDR